MTTFPLSTELVVGEGTTANILPPYPSNEKSLIHEDHLKSVFFLSFLLSTMVSSYPRGRKLTEISFSKSKLSIGGFRAHDYFGDGSLYLLDAPGVSRSRSTICTHSNAIFEARLWAHRCTRKGHAYHFRAHGCRHVPQPGCDATKSAHPSSFPVPRRSLGARCC